VPVLAGCGLVPFADAALLPFAGALALPPVPLAPAGPVAVLVVASAPVVGFGLALEPDPDPDVALVAELGVLAPVSAVDCQFAVSDGQPLPLCADGACGCGFVVGVVVGVLAFAVASSNASNGWLSVCGVAAGVCCPGVCCH